MERKLNSQNLMEGKCRKADGKTLSPSLTEYLLQYRALPCYTDDIHRPFTITMWDSISHRPSKPWGVKPLGFSDGKMVQCPPILHMESTFILLPYTAMCAWSAHCSWGFHMLSAKISWLLHFYFSQVFQKNSYVHFFWWQLGSNFEDHFYETEV